MWDAAFEFGAVALLRRLCSDHGPYHFFLRPRPSNCPPGAHDVPVHLEIVHRHDSLGEVKD